MGEFLDGFGEGGVGLLGLRVGVGRGLGVGGEDVRGKEVQH